MTSITPTNLGRAVRILGGQSRHTQAYGDPRARWFALLAPGLLVTRSIVLVALLGAAAMLSWVRVEANVRIVVVLLLALHTAGTLCIVRSRDDAFVMAATASSLALDALLCGWLAGAAGQLWSPALPLALAVLVIGFLLARSSGAIATAALLIVAASLTIWSQPGTPLLWSPLLRLDTTLIPETVYAGEQALAGAPAPLATVLDSESWFAGGIVVEGSGHGFPTALSVDTSFAGAPAFTSQTPLLAPAFLIAVVALAAGGATHLLRLRRTRSAVAARDESA
jgi:hypothetical protein